MQDLLQTCHSMTISQSPVMRKKGNILRLFYWDNNLSSKHGTGIKVFSPEPSLCLGSKSEEKRQGWKPAFSAANRQQEDVGGSSRCPACTCSPARTPESQLLLQHRAQPFFSAVLPEEIKLGNIILPHVTLWMSFLCLEAQLFRLCDDFRAVPFNINQAKPVSF